MKILVLKYIYVETDFPKTFDKHLFVLKAIVSVRNLRKYKHFLIEFCEKPAGSRYRKYWIGSLLNSKLFSRQFAVTEGRVIGFCRLFTKFDRKSLYCCRFLVLVMAFKKKCSANVLGKSIATKIYFFTYIFVFKYEHFHL